MYKHKKDHDALFEAFQQVQDNQQLDERGGWWDKTLAKSPIAGMFGGVSQRAQGRVTSKNDSNEMMNRFNQTLGRNKQPIDAQQLATFLGRQVPGIDVTQLPALKGLTGMLQPKQIKQMMPQIIDQIHDQRAGGVAPQGQPGGGAPQAPQAPKPEDPNSMFAGGAQGDPNYQAPGAEPTGGQAPGTDTTTLTDPGPTGGTSTGGQAPGTDTTTLTDPGPTGGTSTGGTSGDTPESGDPNSMFAGGQEGDPNYQAPGATGTQDAATPGGDLDPELQAQLDGLSPEELAELEGLAGAEPATAGADPAAAGAEPATAGAEPATAGAEPAAAGAEPATAGAEPAAAGADPQQQLDGLTDAIGAMGDSGKQLQGTAGLAGLGKVVKDITGKDMRQVIHKDPKVKQMMDAFVASIGTAKSDVRERELANYLINHQGVQGGVVTASTETRGTTVNEQRVYNTLGSMGFMSNKWGKF